MARIRAPSNTSKLDKGSIKSEARAVDATLVKFTYSSVDGAGIVWMPSVPKQVIGDECSPFG